MHTEVAPRKSKSQIKSNLLRLRLNINAICIPTGYCVPSVAKALPPTNAFASTCSSIRANASLPAICAVSRASRISNNLIIQSNLYIFRTDQRFTTDNYLQLHRRSHTDAPPLLHAARHVRRYECADCHLLFTASSSLRDHQRIHTGEKPYKCKLCPKSFAQSASLRFHMPIHVGNTIPCPDCDKKFSRPAYLRQHRLTHTGERPLQCPHCSAAYKQKGQLERHIDHSHPNVEHACKECDAVLATLSALKQHVKQAHVGGFVWRAKS